MVLNMFSVKYNCIDFLGSKCESFISIWWFDLWYGNNQWKNNIISQNLLNKTSHFCFYYMLCRNFLMIVNTWFILVFCKFTRLRRWIEVFYFLFYSLFASSPIYSTTHIKCLHSGYCVVYYWSQGVLYCRMIDLLFTQVDKKSS